MKIEPLEARRLLAASALDAQLASMENESSGPSAGASSHKILFIRGADRSGGFLEAFTDAARTEQLADIHNTSTGASNHGWFELAQTLRAQGFIVDQIEEPLEPGAPPTGQTQGAPLPLETLDLAQYAVLVFGSNNAVYPAVGVDAVEAYVRGGGSALFISDANFGSDWADAPDSDQAFLTRFGITVAQDFGVYASERAAGDFLAPDHVIFTGINAFDGEGVSPLFVSDPAAAGVSATLLARAEQGFRVNAPPYANPATRQGQVRPVTPGDASLLVATVDAGRVAGHFDRNTFFNRNGAGTDITRLDNRQFAIHLFTWLATGGGDVTPPHVVQTEFRFETAPQAVAFQISEDVSASLHLSDIVVTNLTTQQTISPLAANQDGDGWASFTLPTPLPDGQYRATLLANSVNDPTGNALAADHTFDFFFLSADANRDGAVNLADFNILAANFGQSPRTFSQGDFNYDGVVNLQDFNILAARFGAALGPGQTLVRTTATPSQTPFTAGFDTGSGNSIIHDLDTTADDDLLGKPV